MPLHRALAASGIVPSFLIAFTVATSASAAVESSRARHPIVVTAVSGDVDVSMASVAVEPRVGDEVLLPARIVTGEDGTLGLEQSRTSISIAPNSEIEIPETAYDGQLIGRLVQWRGNVFYDVEKRGVERLTVETPYLVAVVKGTQFNVAVIDDTTTISLFEGRLEIRDPEGRNVVEIEPGEVAIRSRDDATIRVVDINVANLPTVDADGRLVAAADGRTGGASREALMNVDASLGVEGDPIRGGDETPLRGDPSLGADVSLDTTVEIGPAPLGADVGADIDLGSGTADLGLDATIGLGDATIASDLGASIDLGTGTADVGLDAALEIGDGSLGADLGAGIDLGAAATDLGLGVDASVADLGVDAAVDLGAGIDLGAGTVDLGVGVDASLADVGLDAAADFGVSADLGGALDANLGADVGLGDVGADLGASLDLGNGGLAATIDTGIDLGETSLVDAGLDAGIDLADGSADAGVGLVGLVDAGLDAGLDLTGGDAGLGADLSLGGLDASLDVNLGGDGGLLGDGGLIDVDLGGGGGLLGGGDGDGGLLGLGGRGGLLGGLL